MLEPAVMTEKEKKIIQTFGKIIPKLTENQKNYLLGLGKRMDIAKSELIGKVQRWQRYHQMKTKVYHGNRRQNISSVNFGDLAAEQPREKKG